MTPLSESLGALARALGRLLAFPTKALVVLASGVLAVLGLLLGVLIGTGRTGVVATVALIVAWLALVAPVLSLARRRRRWLRATQQEHTPHQVILPGPADGQEVIPADLTAQVKRDMHGHPGEQDVRILFDAVTESRAPGSRRGSGARMTRALSVGRLSPIGQALGRMEQAQRGLLAAAGGPAAAPYLTDDLRISVAALIGTLIVIPLGTLSAIIVALVLLTQ